MGEDYQAAQVSCHVETKIWIGLGGFLSDGQRSGLMAYSFVADLSSHLRVFWVIIRFAAPVVPSDP